MINLDPFHEEEPDPDAMRAGVILALAAVALLVAFFVALVCTAVYLISLLLS